MRRLMDGTLLTSAVFRLCEWSSWSHSNVIELMLRSSKDGGNGGRAGLKSALTDPRKKLLLAMLRDRNQRWK